MFGLSHVGVYLLRASVEFVREMFQIHRYIVSSIGGACGLVVWHVILVKVPIEIGLAHFLQTCEEFLLHLLQKVESNEYVAVVFKLDVVLGCHFAVDSAFISQALLL